MKLSELRNRFLNVCFEIAAFYEKNSSTEKQKQKILQVFALLEGLYSEKFRQHHTLKNHIIPSLLLFDEVKNMTTFPSAVELAIFMHDVIYNPLSNLNEEASAMFTNSLTPGNVFSQTIYNLITSCKKKEKVQQSDEMLFNDIDYAIIGAEKDEYEKYSNNIQAEYSFFYVDAEYRAGRIAWIKKVLSEKAIFQTDYFQKKFEKRARNNLAWESERLSRK